ncbi:phosphatase domain-containing protein [Bdellovibrio sp. HCB117]|uniref:phosphatase domain-containing protein n=1 Tax=Bdellovibrio sp. HCB117 TaxID=3394359 RepID=UPI0039B3AF45
MKIVAGLVLSLSLVSQIALAKVLVISDIDDTIKVSNVLNKKRAATSFFDDDSRFAGMTDLYQELKKTYGRNIEFHYVSLAPRILMADKHEEFLEENDFPLTKLHTNPGIAQDPELKQKVIRELLAKKRPELVIYFGDNGQFDATVYDQMVKEHPHIPAVQYIREAYSRLADSKYPTMEGQIGFVTSVELAIDLIQREILPVRSYNRIEKVVYKRLKRDDGSENYGHMVFPSWQDCRDFKWQWDVTGTTDKLEVIKAAIAGRCSQE